MYGQPATILDLHGDAWTSRLHREHERHAGVPDYGYCPGRDRRRPTVREITSAMLAKQRADLAEIAR